METQGRVTSAQQFGLTSTSHLPTIPKVAYNLLPHKLSGATASLLLLPLQTFPLQNWKVKKVVPQV